MIDHPPAPHPGGPSPGPPLARSATVLALWAVAIAYLLCIDLKGIWTDEGNRYALFAGGQTWQEFNRSGSFGPFSGVLDAVGPTSYQPLFYLVDNAVIRVARSYSVVLLRAINVVWLLVAALGLLRLFRSYPPWTRLFGVLVLTLNGYMLMQVMQIREYPMYVALAIWSSCLFFEVLEAPGPPPLRRFWPRLVAHGVLLALLFYCHVYCVFVLAAQAVLLLTRRENRLAFLRAAAVSYGTAAALVLPWLVWVYLRFPGKVDPGIWDHRPPTLSLLGESMLGGFRDLLTYGAWGGHPLVQAAGVLVLVGIPVAWLAARRRGEPVDRRAAYALLTLALYACFQIAYFFLREPLSVWPRYFVAHYLGYVVLATCAFSVLERSARAAAGAPWRAIVAGVFLLVAVGGVAQVDLYRKDPFMDTGMTEQCNWRVIGRAMAGHVRPDDTIAYYYPLQAWTIGVESPSYPLAVSYGDILGTTPPRLPSLWLLDTSVMPDYLRQTLDRLDALGYRQAEVAELGCRCRLLRLDSASGPSPQPAPRPR